MINARDPADRHAPATAEEIAAAAHSLACQGFSDHTVAAILKLDVAAVRQLIGQRDQSFSRV
jgi:hypothetical protein